MLRAMYDSRNTAVATVLFWGADVRNSSCGPERIRRPKYTLNGKNLVHDRCEAIWRYTEVIL